VGGLKDDLPRGFLQQSADVVKWVSNKMRDFETLILGNEIFAARTRGVGVLTPEAAVSYGASGPVLHASGVPMDPRKDSPYEKYGEVEFTVPIGEHGDSYDRLWVLVQRIWESLKIIEQCMEKLPAGPYRAGSLPKTVKIDGEIYSAHREPARPHGLLRRGERRSHRRTGSRCARRRSRTSRCCRSC
jgi:NADH:ubiquinone oxidoreductase subunit D